jgi:hypothetical protein
MVEKSCLHDYPPDGICHGSDSDGVKTIDTMDKVAKPIYQYTGTKSTNILVYTDRLYNNLLYINIIHTSILYTNILYIPIYYIPIYYVPIYYIPIYYIPIYYIPIYYIPIYYILYTNIF